MSTIQNYKYYILGAVVLVIVAAGAYYVMSQPPSVPRPIPPTITLQSGNFSFAYPPAYQAKEYAAGVVSVGGAVGKNFIPLVDIVRYKNDPDRALPASFDAFMKAQAQAFCGSDSPGVTVTCSNPVVTPFKTTAGLAGQKVTLTLTSKDTKTAATKTLTYGPIYVFNTTSKAADAPARYDSVFVYPTFSSFILVGTTSPDFVEGIASSVVISK